MKSQLKMQATVVSMEEPDASGTIDRIALFNEDGSPFLTNTDSTVDASMTVKGISKLSTSPVDPAAPIAVGNNDSRMTNPRTPIAHKASHTTGGSDALTASDIGAEAVGAASTAITTHVAAIDPHGDRAYADTLIAAADAMVFKTVIDASANPNYPVADKGWTYRISVAGKLGGAAGEVVQVGDIAICLTDGSAAGTQAAVGANWSIIQANIDGAVIGPSSSTSGELALFSGTSGKLIVGAGLAPTNDDILQRKAGVWTNRTMAQLLTDLSAGIASAVMTFTNKRIKARVLSITSSATPTINTDNYDCVKITALATAVTSMTTNLTGTPDDFDTLVIRIKDDGTARSISFGSSFEPKGVALPTTTVANKELTVGFFWNSISTKWGCVSSAQES